MNEVVGQWCRVGASEAKERTERGEVERERKRKRECGVTIGSGARMMGLLRSLLRIEDDDDEDKDL